VAKIGRYMMPGVAEFPAISYQHPFNRPLRIEVICGVQRLSLEVRALLVRDTALQPGDVVASLNRTSIAIADVRHIRSVFPCVSETARNIRVNLRSDAR